LGIWSALGEVFPDGAELRCWNHRLTNVIDHLPKKEWSAAKELLRKMPYALSRAECERLRDQFAARYRKLCPKAVETLPRDWERMVTERRRRGLPERRVGSMPARRPHDESAHDWIAQDLRDGGPAAIGTRTAALALLARGHVSRSRTDSERPG
jgi:mutator family transposase